MIGKRTIAVAAGAVLMLTAISALALGHGFGGPGGGDHSMRLLARAAGLTHTQIRSVFASDTTLATDRANLKAAHEAMMSCLASTTVASAGCSTQIQSFSTALGAMAQERMMDWQNVLKTAPNLAQAATVYSQLQQLHAQKNQIMQSVFGTPGSEASPASGSGSSNE